MARKKIVMAGTSLSTPGGMTAVIEAYYSGGFVEQFDIVYLPSYESSGIATQIRVMGHAVATLLAMLVLSQVAILHVNSASRGSFWRKAFLGMLAKMFRVPLIFHLHSGEFPDFYSRCGALRQSLIRRVLRMADEVVCLSKVWLDRLIEIEPAAKAIVIGNPVDVQPRRTKAARPVRTVLFFGRLRKKKGVFDLLDAIPVVLARYPDIRFVLAGDEGLQAVKEHATRLGVAHAVVVPGWVSGPEKQKWLNDADIFVLPSHFEALGVSILEAMAAGVPLVATKVGGIPDLIENEVEGLLVEPHAPVSLAEAIIRMCDNEALRTAFAEAAYAKVCNVYSFERVFGQMAEMYQRHGFVLSRCGCSITQPSNATLKD